MGELSSVLPAPVEPGWGRERESLFAACASNPKLMRSAAPFFARCCGRSRREWVLSTWAGLHWLYRREPARFDELRARFWPGESGTLAWLERRYQDDLAG